MAPCGPPPKRWTLWPLERDAARAALRRTDLRGLVDALLSAGLPQLVGIFAGPSARFACKSLHEVVADGESL
jgi:hypothetical protein